MKTMSETELYSTSITDVKGTRHYWVTEHQIGDGIVIVLSAQDKNGSLEEVILDEIYRKEYLLKNNFFILEAFVKFVKENEQWL